MKTIRNIWKITGTTVRWSCSTRSILSAHHTRARPSCAHRTLFCADCSAPRTISAVWMVLAFAAVYLPWYSSLGFLCEPKWMLAAVAASVALILLEYLIGLTVLLAQGKRPTKGIAVHSAWARPGFGLWFSTLLYALLEELLFRCALGYILMESLNAPWYVFVAVSTVLYALNHLRLGGVTVLQKLPAGLCFSMLFIHSGSMLAPMAAHVLQNAVILAFSAVKAGRKERKAL